MNLIEIVLRTIGFYLLPVVLGRGLMMVFSKNKGQMDEMWKIPTYFSLGILIIFGWAMGLNYLLPLADFTRNYFAGVWVMGFLSLILNGWNLRKKLVKSLLKIIPVFSVVLLISTISYGIWSFKSPLPLNWDWFQHQTLTTKVQSGNISYFTSEMSDTFGFDSYPPMFHALMAVAQYPMNLSPQNLINFWQVVSFWHVLSIGLTSFALGYAYSNKKYVGILMAILGVLVFDSSISLTTFFLLPQTLAAVLFTGLFARMINKHMKGDELPVWEVLVGGMALGLTHYMIGVFGVLVYVSMGIYEKLKNRWNSIEKFPWGLVLIVLSMMFLMGINYVDLSQLNSGEAVEFSQGLAEKSEAMQRTYGYMAYVFGVFGLLNLINDKRKNKNQVWLVGFGLLVLYIANAPYVMKFNTLLRNFINLLLALGVWEIVRNQRMEISKFMSGLLVVVSLALVLLTNVYSWKSGLMRQDEFVHISDEEMKASKVLFEKYEGEKTLLISDPATQFVLEGLSGVDSVGGAYMKEETREDLYKAVLDESGNELVELVRDVEDGVGGEYKNRLLALSGRTYMWESADENSRNSYAFNVWNPRDIRLLDFERIVSVSRRNGVKLVYQSPSLVVFEVEEYDK